MKITVLIPTYNCENIIEDCLKSVADIADEILVVDSFSADGTLEICRKYNAKIIQRKYGYSASQKNWAIPQAKNDWILLIDSDERLTSELKNEIKNISPLNPPASLCEASWAGLPLIKGEKLKEIDGFEIARRHHFLEKWLRFGGRYPLYNVRLFKKTCRYEDRNVHAHILLPRKRMKKLKNDIIHLSDRNLEQILEKLNRYSTYQANYMHKISRKGLKVNLKEFFINSLMFKATIKDIWFFIPFSPSFRFCYMYFLRFGFLDGREGFTIALLYSFEDFVSKNKYKQMIKRDKNAGWLFKIRIAMEQLGYKMLDINPSRFSRSEAEKLRN